MTLEHLLIATFAVYRLTLLINKEAGPFDILGKFRTWAGVRYDQYSKPYATGQLSEGLLCPFCLSVWIGFCVTLFMIVAHYLNFDMVAIYMLLPFALSGLAVYLFRVAGV